MDKCQPWVYPSFFPSFFSPPASPPFLFLLREPLTGSERQQVDQADWQGSPRDQLTFELLAYANTPGIFFKNGYIQMPVLGFARKHYHLHSPPSCFYMADDKSCFTLLKMYLFIHLLSSVRISCCSPGWPGIHSAV